MTRLLFLLLLPLLLGGCGPDAPDRDRVLLVTTTTVEASGLLDTLIAAYEASQDRYRVAATAVGSGAALELGRRGDADLLLTHDPAGEARIRAAGHAREQGPLMENEFVIAGPAADSAGIGADSVLTAALQRIAGARAPFVSRADESGTHTMERALWATAGRAPWTGDAPWYIQAGAGMEETLRIASQRNAYVLTDIGSFRNLEDRLDLELLVRGDPPAANRYTYTLPAEPGNVGGAEDLLSWLVGPGQEVIGGYGVERFGEPLFRPTATTR